MNIYGYVFLNGSKLLSGSGRVWIDGRHYSSFSADATGSYFVTLNGDDLTGSPSVKEGGLNGDVIYFTLESYTPRLYANESAAFSDGGVLALNLSFWGAGNNPAMLTIQEICTDNGTGSQYATIYNPSSNPVDLANFTLQKDVTNSTNNYSGPNVTLSGAIGPNSTYKKDLGTSFLNKSAEELKLVWSRGAERIPIDRVEFGNQSTVPDNTTMLDASAPPVGWCIRRVPMGNDTENCFADFQLVNITVPIPENWINLSVHLGWNLLSVPFISPNETLPTVLLDRMGDTLWDRVMWYDPTDSANPWRQYYTGWNSSLNDLTSVNHRMGFWINFTALGDGYLTLGGPGYAVPTSTSIPLYMGWNLAGYPASNDAAYTVGNLKADTGATTVEGYNASAAYGTSVLPDNYVLRRGEAYWIRITTFATNWIIGW
ncbi:MAG: hypothetical protein HZB92_07140 [Euryarchaeota archaeon]|nr:hypothetical protein [Euryarchaeota archaeon]